MSSNNVLQVKLVGLNSIPFKKFVDVLMYEKDIDHEFVESFTRAGLVFSTENALQIGDSLLGCVLIHISDEVYSSITHVWAIQQNAFHAKNKGATGFDYFAEIYKVAENIYKEQIWPDMEDKIVLAQIMVKDQMMEPLNPKLLGMVQRFEEKGDLAAAEVLLREVIFGLAGMTPDLTKKDIFRWNDGFVIDQDLDGQVVKKMRNINLRCGKKLNC